jgi:hypothetical protein
MKYQNNLEKEKQFNFKIRQEICSNNNNNFIVFFGIESESKLSIKAIKEGFSKKFIQIHFQFKKYNKINIFINLII